MPLAKRIREPVTLRDIAATVLELIKLDPQSHVPGVSLARYWKRAVGPASLVPSPLLSEVNYAPDLPEWFPVSKGDMKSLVMGSYHYIRNGDEREELYDIDRDALQQHNLSDSGEGRQLIKDFRKSLDGVLHNVSNLRRAKRNASGQNISETAAERTANKSIFSQAVN